MRIAFDYFIYTYGPTLALTILAAIFGTLSYTAKRLYTRYINTKEKESVAYTVAAFVEQVWKDIHGSEKMLYALRRDTGYKGVTGAWQNRSKRLYRNNLTCFHVDVAQPVAGKVYIHLPCRLM